MPEPNPSRPHVWLVFGMLLSLCLLRPGSVGAQLLGNEQKCVNTANKNAQKIGDAQGKDISSCIKDGAKGRLGTQTIEECTISDPKGKVDKAKRKYDKKTNADCTGGSGFISLADNTTAKDAAMEKELDIINMIFTNGMDAASGGVIQESDNKDDSKCQQALVKALYKCQATKWKEYSSCKKNKLKGKDTSPATTAQELQEACLQADPNDPLTGIPDPKGKIAKKCDLSGEVSRKCPNLNVFPGCASPANAGALSDCLDTIVECKLCQALKTIDGLSLQCDLFDDGLANGSCGCFHDKCVAGAALIPACDPCVTTICALDSFCCEAQWDTPCRGAVFDVCGSSDCAPPCEGDPSLTFVGGPGRMACRGLADQSACEGAYHATINFTAATCFWTGSECRGCGPSNADAGACTNTCEL